MRKLTLSFCIILIISLAACNTGAPQPTKPAEVIPTQTTTPSPTILPATATPIPSPTPSPFPTLPLLPILAQATPERDPSAYHLVEETADQVNENLVRMEQAILGLESAPVPENVSASGPDYAPYYRAAWYAAWNALARFPKDARTEMWRWKMARYMALSGDVDDATEVYSNLLTMLLNSKQASINDLPNHVLQGNTQDNLFTPSFVMKVNTISVPNTHQGFIVTIGNLNHPDTPIAACFLVTQDAGKYSAYFIQHSFIDFGYYIMSHNSIDCFPKDVTDDGIDEIIVDSYSGGHVGSTDLQIFDVTVLPPRAIPFLPIAEETRKDSLSIWNGGIGGYSKVNGKTQIQIHRPLGQIDCENEQIENYGWNGHLFELQDKKINYGPVPYTLDFCTDWVFDYANHLNTQDAASFLDETIKAYQPYAGKDIDLLEEFRIQKALYYIFDGDQKTARSILEEIAASPFTKDSIWAEPIKEFLDAYQTPSDLYKASTLLTACAPYRNAGGPNPCTEITPLDSSSALSYLVNNEYSSTPPTELTSMLKSIGVTIGGEGWFDFDRDGKNELWFTSIDPTDKTLWLWIVVATLKGNDVFFIGDYEPETPKPAFTVDTTRSGHILINYGGYDGEKFELIHDPNTGEADIHTIDPRDIPEEEQRAVEQDLAKFKDLRQMLYKDGDAGAIYSQLISIEQKYQRCPFDFEYYMEPTLSYNCESYSYTLALAAELAGKQDEASKRYYDIWAKYPVSPFALLARLKLQK